SRISPYCARCRACLRKSGSSTPREAGLERVAARRGAIGDAMESKQEGSAARHAAGGKPALQVCAAAWAVCVVLLAGGCYQIRPHVPPSEGHISRATE